MKIDQKGSRENRGVKAATILRYFFKKFLKK